MGGGELQRSPERLLRAFHVPETVASAPEERPEPRVVPGQIDAAGGFDRRGVGSVQGEIRLGQPALDLGRLDVAEPILAVEELEPQDALRAPPGRHGRIGIPRLEERACLREGGGERVAPLDLGIERRRGTRDDLAAGGGSE